MSVLQRLAVAFAITTIFSCSSSPSPSTNIDDQSSNTPFTVLVVSQRAANTDCPAGGVDIQSGFDSNGNGELDATEVTETFTVCHGQQAGTTLVTIADGAENCLYSGKTIQFGIDADANDELAESEIYQTEELCNAFGSLMTVTDLSFGDSECTYGGRQIDTGLDLNENEILDANEVNSSVKLCDDPQQLTLTIDVSPGANCLYGGEAIVVGSDLDGSGTLSEAEIDETTYVCNAQSMIVRTYSCAVDITSVAESPSGDMTAIYRLDEYANYDISVTGKIITPALSLSHSENYGPYVHDEKWLDARVSQVYDVRGTANRGTWLFYIDRDVDNSGTTPLFVDIDDTQLIVAYIDDDNPDGSDTDSDPDVLGSTFDFTSCTLTELN
ncbi:DUF7151 family protein [Reinekea blandensis]|uniref:DUF7151 domain-containing protein n=1 Tax=Reinekea blandensis MED297 TaxID=314283 RepID=A4BGU7_9GAMM|nr:hypothetical protein [Reinekea blandensis]EAR08593.1 hypothetical protein MED297_02775 [Reinekea sp. MED297] [Reinekea blandensis MED297]